MAVHAGSVGEITCRSRFSGVMSLGYVRPDWHSALQVEPHPEWLRTVIWASSMPGTT
ncbi:hypothetical protein [Mycobacterium bourgelatii]|uniref:hypothetical protein n=1 Tax=Mycobacterium bourgelatii TaxID=1273442 RepID=UPI0013D6CD0E|nr:hypothetical protein [Mycobacterium bourgelatii]